MIEQHFLSATGPLQPGERVLWHGHAGVAEYAFDRHASLPRWTLPETTELMVTDQRLMYAADPATGPAVTSGELRWLWPQHLRVQPGTRDAGRASAVTQIQLVCGGSDGTWPALVLAGGDLKTVTDAGRLANVLRQAIARFRVAGAAELGLSAAQSRLLARLLMGPDFSNYQGGPGQTVTLQGAQPVSRPSQAAAAPAGVAWGVGSAAQPGWGAEEARRRVGEGPTRVISVRPGLAADLARASQAAKAEAATQESRPDLASRAADLAARVASLVAESGARDEGAHRSPDPPAEPGTAERFEVSTVDLAERAEAVRGAADRFPGNSGVARAAAHLDRDLGSGRSRGRWNP